MPARWADLIVVDDPIKAQAALSAAERRKVCEFYDNTLYTRLNDKSRGAIVIVIRRLHQNGLVGHVLHQEPWELAVIPATETEDRTYRLGPGPEEVRYRRAGEVIDPTREGRAVLKQVRRTLGSMALAAQYQQDPVPPDGNAIHREWLRYYDVAPPELDLVVACWDTASTLGEASDYLAATVWGLKGTDIGRALMQETRRNSPVWPIGRRPRFDKEAQLLALAPKFEAGQVLLPREAPWLADYLSELLAFPNGAHDDQVDSTSQALNWLSERMARGIPPQRPDLSETSGGRRA
ncbi:MAG: phage terminase large subunit [Bradyrhizobium sp.]|nr:phage terminase large subunit [Bradyrhizobium sp.]